MEARFLGLVRNILKVVTALLVVSSFLLFYTVYISKGKSPVEIGSLTIEVNDNYYSGLITVIVSLFVLALPLAVNAITANQDRRFSNNEMGESFYKNRDYIFMKRAVILLILIMITSYFKKTNLYLDVLIICLITYLLLRFIRFMKVVEGYVADFPNLLIQEEKKKVNKTIGR